MKYYGNRTNYGQSIGILMLNTSFPRIPGDIGNASTFGFPVVYKTIEMATIDRVLLEADPALIQPFIDGGLELVRQGVRAIVTSCGFMAIFQKELAAALPVPVFTSSLLQLPMVYSMLKPNQCVGVITANSDTLGPRHFAGVGASDIPVAVAGIQGTHAAEVFTRNAHELDYDLASEEMADTAKRLIREHPEIGALVLECTNMPPFSQRLREETGLPVFDIVTLTEYVHSAVTGRAFGGFL